MRQHWLLALLILALPTTSIAADLPSGPEVYARFVDEVGGAERIAKVRSIHVDGAYHLELAGGIDGRIRLEYTRPDRLVFEVVLNGFGTLAQGNDGNIAWRVHPQLGNSILEGSDRDQVDKQAARAFSLLPNIDIFSDIENLGVVDYAEQPAYELQLTLNGSGASYKEYFSVESGLYLGRVEVLQQNGADVEMIGWVSEYEEFDGVLIPTLSKHELGAQKWQAKYENIRFNEVDDSVFDLPAPIAELAKSGS